MILWNPYDVALEDASYEMEYSIYAATWRGYLANENPTLAELQRDADADWQEVTIPAGLGSMALMANLFLIGRVIHIRTQVRVTRRLTFSRELCDSSQPSGVSDPRYYKQIEVGTDSAGPGAPRNEIPDNYAMNDGPWPVDNDSTDGMTDAFGRYYHWMTSVDDDVFPSSYNNEGRSAGTGPLNGGTGRATGLRLEFLGGNPLEPATSDPVRMRLASAALWSWRSPCFHCRCRLRAVSMERGGF